MNHMNGFAAVNTHDPQALWVRYVLRTSLIMRTAS